jgi:hypothetical protein
VFLYQFYSIQDFWVKRYKEEIVVIPSVSLILLNVCAWTKTGQQDISFSMSINIMIGLLMFSGRRENYHLLYFLVSSFFKYIVAQDIFLLLLRKNSICFPDSKNIWFLDYFLASKGNLWIHDLWPWGHFKG